MPRILRQSRPWVLLLSLSLVSFLMLPMSEKPSPGSLQLDSVTSSSDETSEPSPSTGLEENPVHSLFGGLWREVKAPHPE